MTENATAVAPPTGADDPARGRLRVLLMMRVAAEAQQRFLDAYQRIRYQAASTEGHLADQLCQSTTDPAEWMIVSEWETPEHFYAWERRAGHRELAGSMISCTTERRSLRYLVCHQTLGRTRQPGGAL
jgi:heme-degrading monooxygenase HmoA